MNVIPLLAIDWSAPTPMGVPLGMLVLVLLLLNAIQSGNRKRND